MSDIGAVADAAILIVDDNAGKRLSIVAVLEGLGHTIVEAGSGEAALREVMRRPYAVILMDVQMPVMDGYETARLIRMRKDCETTPIIFITAHTQDEADTVAYASGAVDFIWAPIVPDVLRAKVAIFVELFLKSRALERSLGQFRDSEAQTRSVLDNVADGIVTLSDDGLIQTFNRAATVLFGYSEREAIGQPFSRMIEPAHPGDVASRSDATRQIFQHAGGPVRRVRRPPPGRVDVPHGIEPERGRRSGPARSTSAACATSPSAARTPRRSSIRRCTTISRVSPTACCSRTASAHTIRTALRAEDLARDRGHGPGRVQARQRHARPPARR